MEQEKKVIPNERLRDEREKRGWTRAYLAEALNLADPKTIGRWKRGVASPMPTFDVGCVPCFSLNLRSWD